MIARVCEICGAAFSVRDYVVRDGLGRSCSTRCAALAKLKSARVSVSCEICGTRFQVRQSDLDRGRACRFCSKPCSYISQRQPPNSKKKTLMCETCGEPFLVSPCRSNAHFCSLRCAGKPGVPRPSVKRLARTCEECGEGFTAVLSRVEKGYARFCSRRCFSASRKPTAPRVSRTCTCGKEFQVLASAKRGGKFCSPVCAQVATRGPLGPGGWARQIRKALTDGYVANVLRMTVATARPLIPAKREYLRLHRALKERTTP